MTARQKFEKHLQFWATRPFHKRTGNRKRVAQLLIEAMDRAWAERHYRKS